MKSDQVSSLFWMAVGLIAVLGALRLGVGTLEEPASGFFAFSAGCFVCLLASIVFFRATFLRQGFLVSLPAIWQGSKWERPLVVILVMAVYILVLERIGFFLSSFLLIFVILKYVEKISWRRSILIPAATLAAAYFVFIFFLKASLPKGILGF